MGARKYGISLQVSNSIAHEWAQRMSEMSSWREISYLQTTMYYFVYHINTIALYWENKWIENPRLTIVECVAANS